MHFNHWALLNSMCIIWYTQENRVQETSTMIGWKLGRKRDMVLHHQALCPGKTKYGPGTSTKLFTLVMDHFLYFCVVWNSFEYPNLNDCLFISNIIFIPPYICGFAVVYENLSKFWKYMSSEKKWVLRPIKPSF